ncbi:aminotransferase class I/II-fold pyridoxal phosphate-dependent enzyme [Woodsholea maritima]|uniref:aminotransferase class I/II-fold pyridoxal phosphate-dependent enzyme n=1 Tax=Woodsholea maritima TaxID=240237 RepID=UPI00035EB42A|nr:pyridoxal phosphate-dependent aminotransferase family protein [Woodsholea maritima]
MREHFEYPKSYVSNLADKSRAMGTYRWNAPVDAYLDNGRVRLGNSDLLMLAGYSYMGFIKNAEVMTKSRYALEQFGLGTHGTRPNCGTTTLHEELETIISASNRSASTTLFPSGFQANFSTISALVGEGDIILGDELNHASIVDGCKLSGAEFVIFKHNNIEDLVEKLKNTSEYKNRLVIVDAVFSMDGDIAPIPQLCKICDDYKAILLVDEAHSLGVLGEYGMGITEYFNLRPGDIDVITGVLSKAIPGTGGYASGSVELGDYLKHNARSYIFSGSLAPFNVAVMKSAFEVMMKDNSAIKRLWENTHHFHERLLDGGADLAGTKTPITPIMFGDAKRSLKASNYCFENGVYLVAVPFPLVPLGKSRLRATVTADHTLADLDFAADVVLQALAKF